MGYDTYWLIAFLTLCQLAVRMCSAAESSKTSRRGKSVHFRDEMLTEMAPDPVLSSSDNEASPKAPPPRRVDSRTAKPPRRSSMRRTPTMTAERTAEEVRSRYEAQLANLLRAILHLTKIISDLGTQLRSDFMPAGKVPLSTKDAYGTADKLESVLAGLNIADALIPPAESERGRQESSPLAASQKRASRRESTRRKVSSRRRPTTEVRHPAPSQQVDLDILRDDSAFGDQPAKDNKDNNDDNKPTSPETASPEDKDKGKAKAPTEADVDLQIYEDLRHLNRIITTKMHPARHSTYQTCELLFITSYFIDEVFGVIVDASPEFVETERFRNIHAGFVAAATIHLSSWKTFCRRLVPEGQTYEQYFYGITLRNSEVRQLLGAMLNRGVVEPDRQLTISFRRPLPPPPRKPPPPPAKPPQRQNYLHHYTPLTPYDRPFGGRFF